MSRLHFAVAASVVLTASAASHAAISLTNGSPSYSQNFDTLPNTGTTNVFVNDSTIPGWHAARTGTGGTYAAGDGSSSTGNMYSFGTTSSSERALGSVGSGNAAAGDFAWGAEFVNNGTDNITSVDIDWTGEQWRSGNALAQTVGFFYRVGGTGFTAEDNTGWTSVPALDFVSPIVSQPAGALNGNAAANRTTLSSTIPVTVAPGESLWVRFYDPDHTGTDHGLSTDDFSIDATFDAIPEPTTLMSLAVAGLLALRRRSI